MTDNVVKFESARDRHLFGPGPKRILALDGGGVRGAITVAFLERIESLLWERYGRDMRLGDFFDLVGGTSTGAIISLTRDVPIITSLTASSGVMPLCSA